MHSSKTLSLGGLNNICGEYYTEAPADNIIAFSVQSFGNTALFQMVTVDNSLL